MNEGPFLTLFFQQIFRYFSLVTPFFGLTVGQILLGLFVCELGAGIFGEFFCSLFNTSAPSREERFDKDYNNYMRDKRRNAMSRHMNFRM